MFFSIYKNITCLIFTITVLYSLWIINFQKVTKKDVSWLIPSVHLSSSMGDSLSEMDVSDMINAYEKAGYHVESGKLLQMKYGTCEHCFGSPSDKDHHMIAAFPSEDLFEKSCRYENTSLFSCYTFKKTDCMLIISDGPDSNIIDSSSWGLYLYDTSYFQGRDLIQAPLYNPVRLERNSRMAIITCSLMDMTESLRESMRKIGMHDIDIHDLPIPEDIVNVGGIIQNRDRLSLILKFINNKSIDASEFYDTMMKNSIVLKLTTKNSASEIQNGRTHEMRSSYVKESKTDEYTFFSNSIDREIHKLEKEFNVIQKKSLTIVRDVFDINDFESCMEKRINCLGEDWDTAFSVSSPIYVSREHDILIIGVDHPESKLTTLGLFDSRNNMQTLTLPSISNGGNIYKLWLANSCDRYKDTCIQWNQTKIDMDYPLFIRERIYGTNNYNRMTKPITVKITIK